ncbi:ATP-binding cassette sub-family C member 10-like [Babylonia areolata]|uniref:ATP-binding cassette sub-family C member 10-like n=1 Tax=Babylonia areolata TaxID=304850 RepID=UPI003FCEF322
MAGWNWQQFCGHGENFTAWNNDDFGHCFEQLVFQCPSHALLAVICSYYIAHRQHRFAGSRLYVRWSWFLIARLVCSLCIALVPIIQILISDFLLNLKPSIADGIVCAVTSLAWIIYSVYVVNLRYMHVISLRGPVCVFLTVLLVVAAESIHTRSVIIQHLDDSAARNEAEEYATYVILGLLVCNLLTLIPNANRSYRSEGLFSAQASYDSRDTEPITWDHIRSYGTIPAPRSETLVAEKGVNCLSWLTFYWVQRLMVRGSEDRIDSVNDIFELPPRLDTEKLESRFHRILSGKKRSSENHHQNHTPEDGMSNDVHHPIQNHSDEDEESHDTEVTFRGHRARDEEPASSPKTLFQALHSAYGWEYYSLGILKLLADGFGFAGPILLNLLVTFIETDKEAEYHGYLYACALLLSTFLGTICSTQFDYNSQVVALKMRCAIITTVYRKALMVSSVAQSKFNTGEIVNFMSTDTDRIINFCPSFHAFWSLPFQIAVSLFLLYQQVGLAFLAGLGFAIILIPINRKLAIKIGDISTRMMAQKDARVKLMNEMLCGIRVLKFYAWEGHFTARISQLRDKELASLKGRKYLDAMCVYFWATTPVLISIFTFTTYALLGHQLTAAKVFTSLSLFLMLIAPLNAFPWVINGLMESWVSLKRVQSFCALQELDPDQYYCPPDVDENVIIQIKGGWFSWQDENDEKNAASSLHAPTDNSNTSARPEGTLQLSAVSFRIFKGQLVGVIGRVGSGKSSLLNAILAEMSRLRGQVSVQGLQRGFALVSQESWIQNATVRDNILFHRPYVMSRYEAVLSACALTEDLKVLPAGDMTEVGENGVTLSGGQKARVALARAVYQDKDIYLLDDPLAAVDAHVARHLMQNCILGLLRNKTCILCTHHVRFLLQADVVMVMEDGKVRKIGPPEEILHTLPQSPEGGRRGKPEEEEEEELTTGEGEGGMMEQEEKEKGVVKLAVYSAYWKAVGPCLSPLVLLSLFLMQASRNTSDWWLSYWVSNSHSGDHGNGSSWTQESVLLSLSAFYPVRVPGEDSPSMGLQDNTTPWINVTETEDNVTFYLTVYGCLAGANSVFTLLRAFLFAYGGICAAKVMHKRLLTSVLKAPVLFFDTTPLGRIINRFSSDMYAIDDSLPFQLNIFLAQIFGILGTLVVTCYGLPWFMLTLVPLGFVYYKIQHYYRHTSRELKRLSSITLSPLYAHFSESIMGLPIIRAFRQTDVFREENMAHLTTNQRAQFSTQAAARWLDLRLRMLGVAIVGSIAFIAVIQHHFQGVDAGLVGLAITYALSVTNLLGGVVMFFTETEKQLVSVERAHHYITSIPYEKWDGSLFPLSCWPKDGVVKFDGVCMRYRPLLPYALNRLSFQTTAGEKLGIVGRTGSGKSSLFLALFRMVEIQEGAITVDGMDLSHLDLTDIRSRFAIIPQDPFLFSGSVRLNLDPTGSHSDHQLWEVLERCHLVTVVERLGGLDEDVGERGRLFSVGQRQLICLARALLTRAKVLCIDEATASVDQETDALVQMTIRSEFACSTVLTIAHRIHTVLDSDRVLVMKDGAVAELAPPGDLLQDPRSLFYQLVHGAS